MAKRKKPAKPAKTARKPRKRAAPVLDDPIQTGELVPAEDADPPADGEWAPKTKQIAYLLAMREALVRGGDGRTSDTAMSEKTGISRMTIWEWKHDPNFVAWFNRELTGASDLEWHLIVDKHTQLAIGGSVRSAEFIARTRSIGIKGGGFTDQGDVVDQSIQNYSVILLSPRPPALPVGGGA